MSGELCCVLCQEPAYASVPMPVPSRYAEPRPDAWLCLSHWREITSNYAQLGWCAGGKHAGLLFAPCSEHSSTFAE